MAGRITVVTFDAAGTLIRVREPVGRTYGRLARAEGLAADDDAVDRAFRRSLANAPPLAVPRELSDEARHTAERAWWRGVVAATLERAAIPAPPSFDPAAFERFFAAAYAHYSEPQAWDVYPEVVPVLAELRGGRGLRLGVISNFDGRLHGILRGLGLADAFAAVIASSEAGAAKPAPEIFALAARELGAPPEACFHVGDSLEADALAPRRAGWQSAWLVRSGETASHPGAEGSSARDDLIEPIESLALLPGLLQ